jgi:small subunit ribosomal protein S15
MANKTNNIKDNTGATENQVIILTDRISVINTHLKINRKDHSSRRGLLLLVSRRRKLLKYLKRTDLEGYKTLIEKLKIRK